MKNLTLGIQTNNLELCQKTSINPTPSLIRYNTT